jgi:serine/threonine protein kinase
VGDQVPLTKTGQVMGTVQYLAPEQATGKTSTGATDLYSLGVVAYEALAGRRPFRGENQMAIAMAHINEMPPALPDSIDPRVQNLVLSCLAKKPNQRPESGASLAIRAEALLREKRKGVPVASEDPINDPVTEVISTDTAPLPRAPIVWPWLATLGLLGLTTIVVIVAILSEPNASDISPISTPNSTPTNTQTVEEATEPATYLVLVSDVVGKNLSEVTAWLTERGFVVNAIPGELIPGSSPEVRVVYAASPTGNIEVGSTVNVTYYVGDYEDIPIEIPEDEATSEPAPEATDPADGEPAPSETPVADVPAIVPGDTTGDIITVDPGSSG